MTNTFPAGTSRVAASCAFIPADAVAVAETGPVRASMARRTSSGAHPHATRPEPEGARCA
ncbi:MAG: hypothetical protein ACT4NY_25410 [Pseudonocardiales bacterium]